MALEENLGQLLYTKGTLQKARDGLASAQQEMRNTEVLLERFLGVDAAKGMRSGLIHAEQYAIKSSQMIEIVLKHVTDLIAAIRLGREGGGS